MQVLVAIHHPDDFDPASEDAATIRNISALNEEMIAAGVRVFAGGLQPPETAKSLRQRPDGNVQITDGPFIESKELVGGFWILETPDLETAIEWGRKATVACRVPVEVRPFYNVRIEGTKRIVERPA